MKVFKRQFCEEMDCLIGEIPISEMIFLKGDFNGHVGNNSRVYVRVHGVQGFGERNGLGVTMLEFLLAFDLEIAD